MVYSDYQYGGQAHAIDMVEAYNKNHILNIPYENCKACETDSPAIDHICCICGQETIEETSKSK